MTFHIGQKVVCINDEWYHPPSPFAISKPRLGVVYRIRAIEHCLIADATYLLLDEVINPIVPGFRNEPDFLATCFRPIVEKKTDISVFTAMLNQKQREHSLCGND